MSENGRGSDLLIRSYDYKNKVNMSAPKYSTGPQMSELAKKNEQKMNEINLKF
jgi:hypothetical protein